MFVASIPSFMSSMEPFILPSIPAPETQPDGRVFGSGWLPLPFTLTLTPKPNGHISVLLAPFHSISSLLSILAPKTHPHGHIFNAAGPPPPSP